MDRALHNDGGQRVRIDPRYTDGVLFDVNGVITDTASIHQAAWAQLFDEYLAERTPADGEITPGSPPGTTATSSTASRDTTGCGISWPPAG